MAPDMAEPPNNKDPPAPPKAPRREAWSTRTWLRLYLWVKIAERPF